MTWTKTATFEDGTLDGDNGFNSTSGAGISATEAAKHGGSYGVSAVLNASEDSYGSFTSLGNVWRAETEFWFDPNSAVCTTGYTQICRVMSRLSNNVGGLIFGANKTAYYLYGFLRVGGSGRYSDDWVKYAKPIYTLPYTMTDAYNKVRMTYCIWRNGRYFNHGLYLYVGGSFVSKKVVGIPNYDIGVTQLDYGVMGVKTGDSGTFYFDDISWATNEFSVAEPIELHTEAYPLLLHAEADMKDQIFVTESPVDVVEGDTRPLLFTFEGGIPSGPTITTYRGGIPVEGIIASATATGNSVITSATANLVGGERIVVCCTATVNGSTQTKKCQLNIHKKGDEQ